jgi:transcriptional regulator with XRE-family HTH domain
MDVRKRVGNNVRRLREKQGVSQEELAARAELHRTYISGVERGVRNPTIVVLEKVADALGVELSALTK